MFGLFKKSTTEERAVSKSTASGLLPDLFRLSFFTERAKPDKTPTAYRCIQLIATNVADSTFQHVLTDKDTKVTKLHKSSIQRLLNHPNPYLTQYDLFSRVVSDLVATGNAFIWVDKNDTETNLWYIPSDQVQVYITQDYKNPFYYNVMFFGQSYVFYPEDIIHFRNPLTTLDSSGYVGLSPVEQHRLTLNSALSHTEYLKAFYDNATQISGVISTERKLTPEAVQQLKTQLKKNYTGKKSGNTLVLQDGMKFDAVKPISPQDTDFINSKRVTDEDICRIFGVPPSMVGLGDTKYSNYEQQMLSFTNNTLNPIITSMRQTLTKSLIPVYARHREKIDIKKDIFNYVESKQKAEIISLLVNTNIITMTEARKFISPELKDIPDLDKTITEYKLEKEGELKQQGQNQPFIQPQTQQPKDAETQPDEPNINNPNDVSNNSAYNNER